MISIFLAEELERATTDIPDTYFLQYFCDSRRDECNTGVAILRGLLFQLLQLQPKLIDYILPRFEVEKSSLFTLETLWKIFEAMICDAMRSTGHESLVRLLLENGAEINLTGELERGSRVTALFCAAARGHIAVLQLLLKKGANVHDESETLGYFRGTALVWAVGKGDKDVALLLIENKANWQAKCEFDGLTLTMLMMAAIGGNVAIVQLLLRKGAKIDED
ncbi:hypothetical protein VE01_03937 [Pseudogymnoascus verrucosus]|uniref:Nephrocystin 3-like N-terminal domain-containing protein n=1 Tax=Pseudogymnoascus verrucosus TaxID=342668 RepID=A0A1B8GPW4_9PEZI|nr:uncharacterized protein VE01_03937 [Pseudogymnoascus verrucosus]OBT97883.1 hypothetical protein VE01_03937 [Pseudogymnoascus verrucosus]